MSQQDNYTQDQELNEKAEQNAAREELKVDAENDNEAFAPDESDPLQKANEALAEQKDKFIRLMAEFDNYKRRTAKETMEIRQTAGKDIIVSLLDVLDDADRAEAQLANDTDLDRIKEGIELVFNKLRKFLESKGVKEMESIHSEFDPEIHEAITQIPAPSADLQGKVIDQVKKGYYMNDKLIRHAQVVVGQ